MDEGQLKKILSEREAPVADANAKKRALNLALAEFDNHQKEKEKKSQGFSILGRLMGSSNTQGRTPMNKRMIYGGMATAMALILVTGITMQQMTETIDAGAAGRGSSAAAVSKVSFNVTGGANNFSRVETRENERTATYRGAIEKNTAQPVPVSPPVGRLALNEERGDRLERERQNRPAKESNIAQPLASMADAEADKGKAEYSIAQAPASAPAENKVMAQEGVARSVASPMPIVIDEIDDPNLYKDVGRDRFEDFEENQIKTVSAEPVSTFSIDVDTSSYAFIRRQLNSGVLPQKDAVRIEELINYFDYDYALPDSKEQPFQPNVTVTPSPWKDGNKLVHIGIKGYDMDRDTQPRSNLVFLIDTSGSMNSPDKLPLAVQSFKLLLDQLRPDDTVGIVVYAGSAGKILDPTPVRDKGKITDALDRLAAGGSTAGGEGVRLAYQLAEGSFDKEAVNRVILASDGDFNVGITNPEELQDFVERKRESGVFLSVLGFGQGNLNDHMMQTLAQNGNGVAAYIDTLNEARKVLVEEATSALFPIAKDVKIQVEFNPATVAEYRLVGYETRHLNREDFNNDAVDAGDIGAGHAVTAIYEITPVDGPRVMDESRYAQGGQPDSVTRCLGQPGKRCGGGEPAEEVKAQTDFGDEYAFLKIRYKLPDQDTSRLITTPITMDNGQILRASVCPPLTACEAASIPQASDDVRFSVAVAGFGQLLKGSKYAGAQTWDDVIEMAQGAKGGDEFGYRAEFINLVRLAKSAEALQKN